MPEEPLDLSRLTRLLVVSPHFDDAVLSAWAAIDGPSHQVCDVMTVFGGEPEVTVQTPSDAACGFRSAAEAMAARRLEDEAALAGAVGRRWWLPLLDHQYTGGRRDAGDAVALSDAVASWFREHNAGGARLGILVPAGAGAHAPRIESRSAGEREKPRGGAALGWLRMLKHRVHARRRRKQLNGRGPAHPDHLFVRDTILAARDELPHAHIFLYEELPYLWSERADDEVSTLAQELSTDYSAFELLVSREIKHERLARYESQLAVLDPLGRLLSASTLPDTERYWAIG